MRWWLWLALGATGASAKTALPEAKDARRLWAYPAGVIVTSDGGRVKGPKDADDDEDEKADAKKGDAKAKKKPKKPDYEAIEDAVTLLGKRIEKDFTDCLAGKRERKPELRAGRRYAVQITFDVDDQGRSRDVELKKEPEPELIECVAKALVASQATRLPPPPEKKASVRLRFDALVLTDDEAKGRGYQYYEAETAWEQALKEKRAEWFGCKKAAECVLTNEMCEVRAVKRESIVAYGDAIRTRKKRCIEPPALERYTAACKAGRCEALRGK